MDIPIFKKLDVIENEIKDLRKRLQGKQKNIASLRGMAKLKVSERELESALSEAKRSLFRI